MANAGDIKIKLKADTKKFNSSMKKSEMAAKKFTGNTTRRFKKMSLGIKTGIALIGVAVLAGVGLLAKLTSSALESAKSIDLLAKSSNKFGISVGNLQKLQFQAALTGVSTGALNVALEGMTRRIAEAATGTGEAIKALKVLGLEAKNLNNLKTDKKFLVISEALKKVKGSAQQAKVAYDIFGRSGMILVNTMNSDLNKSGALFDSLGIKISDSQAKAVESFNDSRLALGLMFSSLSDKLMAELAPALTEVTEKLQNMFKSGEIQEFAKILAGKISKGITNIKDSIPSIVSGFKDLGIVLVSLASTMSNAIILASKLKGIVTFGGLQQDQGTGSLMAAAYKKYSVSGIEYSKPTSQAGSTTQSSASIIKELLQERKAQETGKTSGKGFGGWVDAFGIHVEAFGGATLASKTAVGKILTSRGKGNLGEILGGGVEQAKSSEFNDIARKLAASVQSGKATKQSNDYFLAQLKTITHVAGIGKSAGATSGLLGAIKELQTYISAKKVDEQKDLKMDVDIEFNDPMFSAKVVDTVGLELAKTTATQGT